MQVDKSKIPSNKVYEKHCKGVIWTSLLALVLVALLAVLYFVPIVAYFPDGGSRVDMTGMDLVSYSLRSFVKLPYNSQFERFGSIVQSYGGENILLALVAKNQTTIELVITGFLVVGSIFALAIAFFGILLLIKGHAKNMSLISAMSNSISSFIGLYVALLFLDYFLCRKQFIECNVMDHIRFYITPFLILVAVAIISFALSLIYKKCFRKRVYILNYKVKPIDDPAIKDSLIHQYLSNFPQGSTQIGDYAFDMNTEIKEAIIPEGIVVLGTNAFSNCLNLETVTLPKSLQEISGNCFYNTPKLQLIKFQGTMEEWKNVYKGTDWNTLCGAETIETSDGKLILK